MTTTAVTTSSKDNDVVTRTLNAKAKIAAKADIAKEQRTVNTITKELPKPVVKKVTKVRTESMENLALRLRKEKADEGKIESAFKSAYKAKGIVDIKFITLRVAIYLKIADKAIANTK